MDLLKGEREGTPCGLPSSAKCPNIPDARLPQAEMGRKPAGKQCHIAAIGNFLQQGLLERFDPGGRFWDQVEGGAVAGVRKKVDASQSHLKRLLQTANLGQDGRDPLKFR